MIATRVDPSGRKKGNRNHIIGAVRKEGKKDPTTRSCDASEGGTQDLLMREGKGRVGRGGGGAFRPVSE